MLVPAAIAWVGHIYTQGLKEREIEARFVELGVTILQAAPTKETENLRQWAVEVLDTYSGIPLNTETSNELVYRAAIPSQVTVPSAGEWFESAPSGAFCYQADTRTAGQERYAVSCHASLSRCNYYSGKENPAWKRTACVLTDLSNVSWQPEMLGKSAWTAKSARPFPPPFPQIGNE